MRLSVQTDYALRTLMFLAVQGKRVTIVQVAEMFGISSNHVAKVVNILARLEFIRSVRGVGGGIELARAPDEISVGEVVLAFEGNMRLLDCVAIRSMCVIQSFCKLKDVMAEAEKIQIEYLEKVTLDQVIPTQHELVTLLPSKEDN